MLTDSGGNNGLQNITSTSDSHPFTGPKVEKHQLHHQERTAEDALPAAAKNVQPVKH